jgi:peptidylprolyl isomerase
MADPAKGVSKNEMMQYLVPAIAIGALIILVGLVVVTSGSAAPPQMSDGSDGTEKDPALKEIVPGLWYRDVKEGLGEACPAGANVTVHYAGWLTNGTEFDNSRKRGKPADFSLNQVVRGWTLGIPGMKPGGIRKLVIAPALGYGDQSKANIPANSTLIFEVELLSATAPPGAAPAGPYKMIDGSDSTATDPGLRELTPGVKARDLKEGTGEAVKPNATVTIHYVGWLTDGTVFDSSRARGEPSTFPLEDLVKGWQEGIPGMKPGGVRKLVIAPDKGYGARARGKIPANATLIFEIELVK